MSSRSVSGNASFASWILNKKLVMLSINWIKNFDLLCWESLLLLCRLVLDLLRCLYLRCLCHYWWLWILIHTSGLEGCHWISTKVAESIISSLVFLQIPCIKVKLDFSWSLLLLHYVRLTHPCHRTAQDTTIDSVIDITPKFTIIILRGVIEG